jgi:hypothetical protein
MKKRSPSLILFLSLVFLTLLVFFSGLLERTDGNSEEQRTMETRTILLMTGTAIQVWIQDKGRPPSVEEGLTVLGSSNPIVDGWGRPFVYHPEDNNGHEFKLYSLGPQGKDENGKGKNIDYWSVKTDLDRRNH